MDHKTWQVHALAAALEGVAAMASYEPVDADDMLGNDAATFHHYLSDAIASLLLEARTQGPAGPTFLVGANGRAVVALHYPRATLHFAPLGEGLSHWVTLDAEGVAESHPTALDAARAVWARAGAPPAEDAPRCEGADAPRHRLWLTRECS